MRYLDCVNHNNCQDNAIRKRIGRLRNGSERSGPLALETKSNIGSKKERRSSIEEDRKIFYNALDSALKKQRRRRAKKIVTINVVFDKPYDLINLTQIKLTKANANLVNQTALATHTVEYDRGSGVLDIKFAEGLQAYEIKFTASNYIKIPESYYNNLSKLSDIGRVNERNNGVSYLQVRYVNCVAKYKGSDCYADEFKTGLAECCFKDTLKYKEGWNIFIREGTLESMLEDCIKKSIEDEMEKRKKMGDSGEDICLENVMTAVEYKIGRAHV